VEGIQSIGIAGPSNTMTGATTMPQATREGMEEGQEGIAAAAKPK
jgi:hypothetical protein